MTVETQCHYGGPPHIGHCLTDFCHIHGVHEPDQPDDYHACVECWHVYRTKEELEAAHEKWDVGHLDAEDIFACPLCTHDF
jgi:hypothetical protein